MTQNLQDLLLVGVDGGATEAKAHHVRCVDEAAHSFSLCPVTSAHAYERMLGFEPVPVGDQFAQRDAGDIRLSSNERVQGAMLVQAAAEGIANVCREVGGGPNQPVLVGIGMPGLKTADGRGIAVMNNGPRIPDYLVQLEQRLGEMGVKLAAPIAAIGSDADYCGIGEESAAEGLFRDVKHAYYCGCGTGIADAFKLRGRLVPFDAARTWIQKSWQMPTFLGPTFEKLVSVRSLNERYATLLELHNGDTQRFPEADAAAGHAIAVSWMRTVALIVAELIYERLDTVRNGRANAWHRGEAYASLSRDHEYRGIILERVILGQRMATIYGDSRFQADLRQSSR